jgi:Domain of unknown function (DUF4328)/Protein of unknown function (DUF2510)
VATPPPGWYPDPWRQAPLRYWDGVQWTGYTSGPPAPADRRSPAELLERERVIAPWLRGLLFLWPIGVALSFGGLVSTIDDVVNGDGPTPEHGLWWIGQLGGFVSVGVLVLRIVWLYRAASVARALGFDARREPMLAGIGWIIPIINYWWPFQGMTDCFPEGERPDRRIAWWWAMSIISGVSLVFAAGVPFVPVGVAVVLVALALAPALATAVLEVGLVADVLAAHERRLVS